MNIATEILSLEGALHGDKDWTGGAGCDCFEGCDKTWQPLIAADICKHTLVLQECWNKDVRATNFKWTMLSNDNTVTRTNEQETLQHHGYELKLSTKQWGRWFSGHGLPFWKCSSLKPIDVRTEVVSWETKRKTQLKPGGDNRPQKVTSTGTAPRSASAVTTQRTTQRSTSTQTQVMYFQSFSF